MYSDLEMNAHLRFFPPRNVGRSEFALLFCILIVLYVCQYLFYYAVFLCMGVCF